MASHAPTPEQTRLLLALVEGTSDLLFVKDRRGRYLFVNAACVRHFGRSEEEILGCTDADLCEPIQAARRAGSDRAVLETGDPIVQEDIEHLIRKSPYRDEQGTIIGVMGVAVDISDRLRAEEALRESELRFRAIFESAAVGAAVTGTDGRMIETTRRTNGWSATARRSFVACTGRR